MDRTLNVSWISDMTPDDAVRNFRDFLSAGYPQWRVAADLVMARESLPGLGDVFDDWAQANWELPVERTLCGVGEFLGIYGDGSDYEAAAHSRVFFHDELPTHELVCDATGESVVDQISGAPVTLEGCSFDRLVANVGTWFADVPPFDHVLLYRGEDPILVRLSEVRFALQSTETS
jgi:hypothetical protein